MAKSVQNVQIGFLLSGAGVKISKFGLALHDGLFAVNDARRKPHQKVYGWGVDDLTSGEVTVLSRIWAAKPIEIPAAKFPYDLEGFIVRLAVQGSVTLASTNKIELVIETAAGAKIYDYSRMTRVYGVALGGTTMRGSLDSGKIKDAYQQKCYDEAMNLQDAIF